MDSIFLNKLKKNNIIHDNNDYRLLYKFNNLKCYIDKCDNTICIEIHEDEIINYNNIFNIKKLIHLILHIFPKYSLRINTKFNISLAFITKRFHSFYYCKNTLEYYLFILPYNYCLKQVLDFDKWATNKYKFYIDYTASLYLDTTKIFKGRLTYIIDKYNNRILFNKPLFYWYTNNYDDFYLNIKSKIFNLNKIRLNKKQTFCDKNDIIKDNNYFYGDNNIKIVWGFTHKINHECRYNNESNICLFHKVMKMYFESKVKFIQRSWRKYISDPSYSLCKKRLIKEFNEMSNI